MTAFFVGGLEPGAQLAESAYLELRARSEEVAGCAATRRRIFKLSCRLDGRDREIEVGRPLSSGGEPVTAIIDHGLREAFVVHTAGGHIGPDTPVQVRPPAYAVVEFS